MIRIKTLCLALGTLVIAYVGQAQNNSVGINTGGTVNARAVLELVAPNDDQGLLIPRVSNHLNVGGLGSAEAGMMVFNTSQGIYYHWDGGAWRQGLGILGTLTAAGDLEGDWPNLTITDDFVDDIAGNGLSATAGVLDFEIGDFSTEIATATSELLVVNGTSTGRTTRAQFLQAADLENVTIGAGSTILPSVAINKSPTITFDGNLSGTVTLTNLGDGTATLNILDDVVDRNKINADVAGDGLTQAGDGSLQVNAGNGIQLVADAVAIDLAAIDGAGVIENAGVLDVNVDGTTLGLNGDVLRVNDAGINTPQLADNSVTNNKIPNFTIDAEAKILGSQRNTLLPEASDPNKAILASYRNPVPVSSDEYFLTEWFLTQNNSVLVTQGDGTLAWELRSNFTLTELADGEIFLGESTGTVAQSLLSGNTQARFLWGNQTTLFRGNLTGDINVGGGGTVTIQDNAVDGSDLDLSSAPFTVTGSQPFQLNNTGGLSVSGGPNSIAGQVTLSTAGQNTEIRGTLQVNQSSNFLSSLDANGLITASGGLDMDGQNLVLGTVTVNDIETNLNLSAAGDALVTAEEVKDYVDNRVDGQDLNQAYLDGNTITTTVGGGNVTITGNQGVNISASNGLTVTNNLTVLSGQGIFPNVDINGGNIDNTIIGASTRAAGNFTDLNANGTVTFPANAITDAFVENDLTIEGGTIDSSPIGTTTPSTGVFTSLAASGAFSLTGDDLQDDEVVDDLTIAGGVINATPIGLTNASSGRFSSLESTGPVTLGNDAIQANEIENNQVTLNKIADGSPDQLLATDGSGNPIYIAQSAITVGAASDLVASTEVVEDSEVEDDITIDGGSVNNSPIGASGASSGAFTTLSATSTVVFPNDAISDLEVANNITIDGGSIENTPVGQTTPRDGGFTNLTSTTLNVTGTVNLSNDAIQANEIQNGEVTLDKIEDGSPDQLLATDASGNPTYIAQSAITVGTASDLVASTEVVDDSEVANDITIDGGSVDNSPIGATGASSGIFTTLEASTSIQLKTRTIADVVTGIGIPGADSAIPTEKAVRDAIDDASILGGVSANKITVWDGTTLSDSRITDDGVTPIAFGGDLSLGGNDLNISGGTINVAVGSTVDILGELDVSLGTFTLADDQISGNKISGGTIDNVTLATSILNSSTFTGTTIFQNDLTFDETNGDLSLAVSDQTGNATLGIPDLGGISDEIALKSQVDGINDLTDANIYVGNAGVATEVTISGDASLSNTGVLTLGTGVVNSDKVQNETLTAADIQDGSLTAADLGTLSSIDINGGTIDNVVFNNATFGSNIVFDEATADLTLAVQNQSVNNTLTIPDLGGDQILATLNDINSSQALTSGSIYVGVAGVEAEVVASGDGNMLIGDGTTVNSVGITGDLTLDNTGDAQLVANAVGTNEIADGTILSEDILDGTITTDDIANGTITSDDLTTLLTVDVDGGTIDNVLFNNATFGSDIVFDEATADLTLAVQNQSVNNTLTIPDLGGDQILATLNDINSSQALTSGSIYVGVAGVEAEVVASGDGNMLIGDGTTVNSVGITGDLTLDNTGDAQLVANAVGTNEIADGTVANGDLDKANIPLSGFGPAVATVDVGSNLLSNVLNPVGSQDAATKDYVDTNISSVDVVLSGTTGAIPYWDGIDLVDGTLNDDGLGTVSLGAGETLDVSVSAGTLLLAAGEIESADIATDAVTATQIANGAVGTDEILDGTITSDDLTTLTTVDVDGGTIDNTNIGATVPAAVTSSKMSLAANPAEDLSGGTNLSVGSLSYLNVNDDVTGNTTITLTAGTDGQMLVIVLSASVDGAASAVTLADSGSTNLSADWVPQGDQLGSTLTLLYSTAAGGWVELHRSIN